MEVRLPLLAEGDRQKGLEGGQLQDGGGAAFLREARPGRGVGQRLLRGLAGLYHSPFGPVVEHLASLA